MKLYLLLGIKAFTICTIGSFTAFLLADLFALLFAGIEVGWESLSLLVYKSLKLGGVLTVATIIMVLINKIRS